MTITSTEDYRGRDVSAADLVEDGGRVGAVQAPQPRMGRRLVRWVTVPGMAFHWQSREVTKARQPRRRDNVGRVGAELSREPAPEALGHVGADLQADHARVSPGGKFSRDQPDDRTGRQVRVLVRDLVGPRIILRPPGDTEEEAGQLQRPREKRAQVVRDHLLQAAPSPHGPAAAPSATRWPAP